MSYKDRKVSHINPRKDIVLAEHRPGAPMTSRPIQFGISTSLTDVNLLDDQNNLEGRRTGNRTVPHNEPDMDRIIMIMSAPAALDMSATCGRDADAETQEERVRCSVSGYIHLSVVA